MKGRHPAKPCGCTGEMLCQDAAKIFTAWCECYEMTRGDNKVLQRAWRFHRLDVLYPGWDAEPSHPDTHLVYYPDWRTRLEGHVLPQPEPEPVARRKQ